MGTKNLRRRSRHVNGCIGILCLLYILASSVLTGYATESQPQGAAKYNLVTLSTLATIAAAGASGQFDVAEQVFRQGKERGLSELQMYEAVLNLLPYIGYPRTLSTMSRFQQVYPHYIRERSGDDPQPTEPWREYASETWGERGAHIQQQLGFGGADAEEFTQQLTLLSPELTEWVRYDDFGRVFGRPGLSLIEREAIVIGVLIAQGAPQIVAHHRAMLRVGGSEALIDSLVEAVSGIVDEKALAAARQHIAEARQQ